jgi:hypothetical protein
LILIIMDKVQRFFNPGEEQQAEESGVMSEVR